MTIWMVRERDEDKGTICVYTYFTKKEAEDHLRKYLAARIRDCGELGYAFQRTEKQCMKEMHFDDLDGTWIGIDKLEVDHGQRIEMED